MRKSAIALMAIAGVLVGAPSTHAVTLGVAVDGVATNNAIAGSTVTGAANPLATHALNPLGFDAIKYYIPLTSTGTCVYGVSCGTASDSGTGGTVMSMFLEFSPVSTIVPSLLEILFEDLDLINANDPNGFFESIRIFDSGGVPLTDPITTIGGLITGDAGTQQLLSLALGIVSNPFYAELKFAANSSFYGTNTPEYLIATVRDCIVGVDDFCPTQQVVPLPAAFPLFATALGGMGLLGWRRKRKAAAAA